MLEKDHIQFERSVNSSEFRSADDDARGAWTLSPAHPIEHEVTERVDMGRIGGNLPLTV